MFGNPVYLPPGNDDKQAYKNVLMEPGIRNKEKIWTRTREGGKKEILKETKNHPLATIDKEQLLDMMEMLEARHQQYEKESREREAKVFNLLESQQQWISGMAFRLDHQFLQFPAKLDSSVEYISRRGALVGRRVLEATVIDPDILRDAGLWGEIEPFLHRTWVDGDARFTCRGWDRLMATQDDTTGGVHRECSLREFGRRTEIYTDADLQHHHFTQFLEACTQGQPERATNTEVCTPLSNIYYEVGTSRESHLHDPLHRLMHRIVSTSIMGGRREGVRRGHDISLGPRQPIQVPSPPVRPSRRPVHPCDGRIRQQSLGSWVFHHPLGPVVPDSYCSGCSIPDRYTSSLHYSVGPGEDGPDRAAAARSVCEGTDRGCPGPPASIRLAWQEAQEAACTSRASTTATVAGGSVGYPPTGDQGRQDGGSVGVDRRGVVSDKCGVTVPPPLVLTTGVFTVALQLQIVKSRNVFVRICTCDTEYQPSNLPSKGKIMKTRTKSVQIGESLEKKEKSGKYVQALRKSRSGDADLRRWNKFKVRRNGDKPLRATRKPQLRGAVA
ncbi:hypothetical protein L2E82_22730 [Cichorium intybus]|uniref:Uncharacterized protein n=1 Tax=Cichorium intybus TaxID=13427 RepID=A0ACB9DYD0_CICIN|nr:hypothetical protein L2E82_22730 [Cichorium intybus]